MNFLLPYDRRHIPVEIDDRNFVGTLVSKVESYKPGCPSRTWSRHPWISRLEVRGWRSWRAARGTLSLSAPTTPYRTVQDHYAYPVAAHSSKAQPDANIRILVATGFHRASTRQELIDKYGQEIVDHEQIVMHAAAGDDNAMVKNRHPAIRGRVHRQQRSPLRRTCCWRKASSKPHLFAGFSGGRKSVLPGSRPTRRLWPTTAASSSIHPTRGPAFFRAIPFTRICCMPPRPPALAFIVNVILNGEREIIASFAGGLEEAHAKETEFLTSLALGKSSAERYYRGDERRLSAGSEYLSGSQGTHLGRGDKQGRRRDHYGRSHVGRHGR